MDPNFLVQVYHLSKNFGGRPYTYVCPELEDTQAKFNFDSAVYLCGIRDEAKRAQEEQKRIDKEIGKEGKFPKRRETHESEVII